VRFTEASNVTGFTDAYIAAETDLFPFSAVLNSAILNGWKWTLVLVTEETENISTVDDVSWSALWTCSAAHAPVDVNNIIDWFARLAPHWMAFL